MDLKIGLVCDRGLNPKRPVNQDNYLALPDKAFFAVFDGVGGQKAGEVASQTAAESIEETLSGASNSSPLELIRRAIRFANRDVYEMAETDPTYKTMATTVALLYISGDRATLAHVGDSRVYRLEDGRFYRETIDHTDLDDAIRAGRITKDNSRSHLARNVINRALGVESEVEAEIKSVAVGEGTRFLLCSDGVYTHLSDEELARVLSENKDPQSAADELKRIVYQRGADDNLTALVVQVGQARHGKVVAVHNEVPDHRTTVRRGLAEGRPSVTAATRKKVGVSNQLPSSRIHVELPNDDGESRPPVDNWAPVAAGASEGLFSKRVMYALLVLVLVAGSFYAGLRASDSLRHDPSNNAVSELTAARREYESGNHAAAESVLTSIVIREPQNAEAYYWLGRAQLSLGLFAKAATSFEQTVRLDPSFSDAYVQGAAAYESQGERAGAINMLARYAEVNKKRVNASGR